MRFYIITVFVLTKEKLEYLNTNYAQMNFSKKKLSSVFIVNNCVSNISRSLLGHIYLIYVIIC